MAATAEPRPSVTVEVMRMQLTALFAMAAYFVYATTFAGVIAGVLPMP